MKAVFYVVFDAQIKGGRVSQVKARRITLQPPGLAGGEVAVRFETDVPDSAFLRLMPTAEVTIPDGWWTSTPVTVHVEEPPQ